MAMAFLAGLMMIGRITFKFGSRLAVSSPHCRGRKPWIAKENNEYENVSKMQKRTGDG